MFKEKVCDLDKPYDGKFAVKNGFGVDIAYNGNIYVAGGYTINIYDPYYNNIGTFTSNLMNAAADIVVDNNLKVFVSAQTGNSGNRILKFNSSGEVITKITGGISVVGIGIDEHGSVYVPDVFNNIVIKLDNDLNNPQAIVGPWVTNDSTFKNPIDVAVDANNNIFVSTKSGYIWKFKSGGKYVTKFGPDSHLPARSSIYIGCLAIDGANNIFVADKYYRIIVKYSNQGEFIKYFIGKPSFYNQFEGLAIDKNCNLWAADGRYIHRFSDENTSL